MSKLKVLATLKIHEGKLAEFKQIASVSDRYTSKCFLNPILASRRYPAYADCTVILALQIAEFIFNP